MKTSDLPTATMTMKQAREKFMAMDPLDRGMIVTMPFEDVDDGKPTEGQMIRIIEHYRKALKLLKEEQLAHD